MNVKFGNLNCLVFLDKFTHIFMGTAAAIFSCHSIFLQRFQIVKIRVFFNPSELMVELDGMQKHLPVRSSNMLFQ